jgi:hypothetical protein
MARKMMGEKAVYNRLQKFFEITFTEEQQEYAEFYTDIEGTETHTWKFDIEEDTHLLTINKFNGKITHQIK